MKFSDVNTFDMHGILLLGGTGSRLRAVTNFQNKHLLRIGKLTLAELALQFLEVLGIKNITIVVNPSDLETFQLLLDKPSPCGPILEYRIQHKPLGTAHAVSCALNTIQHRNVIVLFGDNIFQMNQGPLLQPLGQGPCGRLFLTESSHPEHFGVVEISSDGNIVSIQDKPQTPKSNLVCTGLMQFTIEAFDFLENISLNSRGERDIMDLVRLLWSKGRLSWTKILGKWMDVASAPGQLEAAREFAKEIPLKFSPK